MLKIRFERRNLMKKLLTVVVVQAALAMMASAEDWTPKFYEGLEANGTVTANAPGKGDMTGSYTYRGVTMSGSIHIESIEEWFTVGLQFEIDQRGRSYTIHDITAVKNSHFSGPHDEKYVRLNAGEFSYDASGSISVEESGSSLIVTASGRGSLTISYRCPVSGEEVSDTVSF